jgi:hypothetical protein
LIVGGGPPVKITFKWMCAMIVFIIFIIIIVFIIDCRWATAVSAAVMADERAALEAAAFLIVN